MQQPVGSLASRTLCFNGALNHRSHLTEQFGA